MDPRSFREKPKWNKSKNLPRENNSHFFFFPWQYSVFSGEGVHLGQDEVSYKTLLCVVQTSNRNLGASIFALGLGSFIQAKFMPQAGETFHV